jgi:hypothetical protein
MTQYPHPIWVFFIAYVKFINYNFFINQWLFIYFNDLWESFYNLLQVLQNTLNRRVPTTIPDEFLVTKNHKKSKLTPSLV